ncbi:TPA: hypothetical protein EYG59_15290, partial [Candidatus Poribacteria bacterium]|nr:hypothetical protein [Candidatus Poribacteria bacterium]
MLVQLLPGNGGKISPIIRLVPVPLNSCGGIRNDKVVLEANQDYWAGRAKIDQLIFRSIPDNSIRLLELQNGSIQVMEFP